MKKLFISCPMKGRTYDAIKMSVEKMHKIAEIIFDQDLEDISIHAYPMAPEGYNKDIWNMWLRLKTMAQADYFIGCAEYNDYYPECHIENEVAFVYGIPATFVDVEKLMPDAAKAATKGFIYQKG